MHFSGDISLGTIVSVVAFLSTMIPLFLRLGRIISLFEQFPPHRHFGSHIFYPKGMDPNSREDDK